MNRRNSFRAACKLVTTDGAAINKAHLYETLNRPAVYEKRSKNTLTPSSLFNCYYFKYSTCLFFFVKCHGFASCL